MDDELSERIRRIIREELERFSETVLPKVVQAEVEFALRRDSGNIERVVQREMAQEAVDFIRREMSQARGFSDKFELLEFALSQVKGPGLFLEFGVYAGDTINFIAERLPVGEVVTGFDSFEGLPEDWRAGYSKGAYKIEAMPTVHPNVHLVKGLFAETLPPFVQANEGPVAFLHMDADLYSSAMTVFENLADRIAPGTVIVFDEFFNYPGWKDGEHRAFKEFVSTHSPSFEYIGFTQGWHSSQVAVKITESSAIAK